MDDAEHCCRRTDAEREGQDGHDGHTPHGQKRSHGVSEVAGDCVHQA
jgi:hypothetical protein